MAINEIITTGHKFRKCIDNTPGNKKWLRYSWWTKASDVEFNDGSNAETKLGGFKGVTTNENQVAGYSADITLVKTIKTALNAAISGLQATVSNLSNLVTTINNKLGGMRFYEDATGKYVVGADSVPKKLGSAEIARIVVGEPDEKSRKNFDIKPLYSGYANLTVDNFAFQGCAGYKWGGQGINDEARHWISLGYDSANGILLALPEYKEWGPGYDRTGEGFGSGPRVKSSILLFAPKL